MDRLALSVFLVWESRSERSFQTQISKAWDNAKVKTFELPLSNGKPAQYMSAAEYYAIPARTIYRTYPGYRPDREPADCLKSLEVRGRPSVWPTALTIS